MCIFAKNFNEMIIPEELYRIKAILDSFLGESKQDLDASCQLEYPCPRCVEKYGNKEIRKYNLSISLSGGVYNCWKCSDESDDEMHGSLIKLIKIYGNERLLKEYKEEIRSLRDSKLYKIGYAKELNINTTFAERDDIKLPTSYRPFKEGKYYPSEALEYLQKRGISWDIINEYNIGFTTFNPENKIVSNRIIIPSYNKFGELNYWTGRDFTGKKKQKYFNPVAERKEIIFNEEKVQWDADVTLVEGPFDHIVVPNSIPLLGKSINKDFKLYWEIIKNANAHINLWLDDDAMDSIKSIYKELNHGRLYDKIRIITTDLGKDPSEIYEKYGNKGIINALRSAKKVNLIF